MPASDLTTAVPGALDEGAATDGADSGASNDGAAARIAELEATVAQQTALIAQLSAERQALETVPRAQPGATRRVIGTEWQGKTAAQWMGEFEAGNVARPNEAILCADGWLAAPGR